MTKEDGQKRVRGIYHKLFEIAAGNPEFRIDDPHHDNLSVINMIEVQYVFPHYTTQDANHFVLLLDLEDNIISTGKPVINALGIKQDRIGQTKFTDFLSGVQKEKWHGIMDEIRQNEAYQNNMALNIETASGKIIPSFCNITRLAPLEFILISSIITVPQDVIPDRLFNPLRKKMRN